MKRRDPAKSFEKLLGESKKKKTKPKVVMTEEEKKQIFAFVENLILTARYPEAFEESMKLPIEDRKLVKLKLQKKLFSHMEQEKYRFQKSLISYKIPPYKPCFFAWRGERFFNGMMFDPKISKLFYETKSHYERVAKAGNRIRDLLLRKQSNFVYEDWKKLYELENLMKENFPNCQDELKGIRRNLIQKIDEQLSKSISSLKKDENITYPFMSWQSKSNFEKWLKNSPKLKDKYSYAKKLYSLYEKKNAFLIKKRREAWRHLQKIKSTILEDARRAWKLCRSFPKQFLMIQASDGKNYKNHIKILKKRIVKIYIQKLKSRARRYDYNVKIPHPIAVDLWVRDSRFTRDMSKFSSSFRKTFTKYLNSICFCKISVRNEKGRHTTFIYKMFPFSTKQEREKLQNEFASF